ncbi:hypothetical protein O4H53_25095 [Sulfitobacter sp. G21635-S1]|uniref:hypothetical protein n=1 Tax=Sulfitobacter sp. G21635-S1 TaxID=3014043 RepID=UPI0022AEBABF|nr:hypothetical protein [Sulfitobacter sp. G21635-S1]MCZ4258833.1 hypothetical protein [Sulfitobacter sp. G21635-S1]
MLQAFGSTVLASAFGFVIAKIATAFFDAYISKASTREKERSEDVSRIRETTESTSSIALGYWSRDAALPSDKGLEAMLSGQIAQLTALISGLFDGREKLLEACVLELDRFDEAVTGGDFGTNKRTADMERLRKIQLCGVALEDKVKTCRRKLRPYWFG